MRRNRFPVEETVEDDSGEWIMSYGDTVTLLLCFFIIFFAETNKQGDDTVLMKLSKTHKQTQSLHEEDAEAARSKAMMLSKIETEVRSELANFEVEQVDLGIERRRKEVLLRLYENDFFHIGSFELKPTGTKILKQVASLLKPFEDKVIIRVEGHSDSLPVSPFSPYKTNLKLSSLRASQAANTLVDYGVKEPSLRVVGFGSADRFVDDRMPAAEGKLGKYIPEKGLRNRRIEIRIQVVDEKSDKEVDLRF